MDPIKSLPEDLAVGEIAELYRDIKETLQVPVTNLVWRHLATIDGALALVWNCVKPLYGRPTLEREAEKLRDLKRLAAVPKWPRATLRSSGVNSSDRKTIDAVLANYNQTNPRNLIVFMALREKLNGADAGASPVNVSSRNAGTLAAVTIALPRLIPPSEMSPEIQHLARALHAVGISNPAPEIVAGVPRHLAHWPGFLALAVEMLLPVEREIGECIALVQTDARESGRSLIAELGPINTLSKPEQILPALNSFTSRELIANYIVKVRMLQLGLR